MSDLSARTINSLLLEQLDTPGGREKVAVAGQDFIRMRLREVSFARKILVPEAVTVDECQRSIHHDSLVKIVDKEPDSRALAMSIRGEANTNYVEGDRFEIPFFRIASEDFQKSEDELLAYNMPLMDVLEKNSVLDIQKIEDQAFMDHIELILGTNVATQVVSGLSYEASGSYKRDHFRQLFNLLDGNELKLDCMLINTKMWNRFVNFPATDIGDDMATEIFRDGQTFNSVFGRKVVVTNKKRWNSVTIHGQSYAAGTDLVPDNMIYGFASPEFLGKFYTLGDTKFWIDKRKDIISMGSYETVGMGIGNVKAVVKIWISG